MKDWKEFIERVDRLAVDLVGADISKLDDLNRILGDLKALRAEPEIKALNALSRAIVSAAAAASSVKTFTPDKSIKILSFLCSELKAIFECLNRAEDPASHIKSIEENIKNAFGGGPRLKQLIRSVMHRSRRYQVL